MKKFYVAFLFVAFCIGAMLSYIAIVNEKNNMDAIVISNTRVAKKTNQIITVVADGSFADITYFKKSGIKWKQKFKVRGFIGSEGMGQADDFHAVTPQGSYELGPAFGVADDPGSKIEYKKITNTSYYIGDFGSDWYGTWQEGGFTNKDNEHLIDYPVAYKYAMVINYNTKERIKGKGSAFFLHCETGNPTGGCVSLPENYMKFLVNELNTGSYIINVTNKTLLADY